MIVAVPAVVHVAIARDIDRSVQIILNEIDLSLTGSVAAAIGSPVLALTERNPQVYWLIIFWTQRPNQYRAGIVKLRIGKALNTHAAVIVRLTELDAEAHLSQDRGAKQGADQSQGEGEGVIHVYC